MRACPGGFATIQAAGTAADVMPGKQNIRICQRSYAANVNIGHGSNELDIKKEGNR